MGETEGERGDRGERAREKGEGGREKYKWR